MHPFLVSYHFLELTSWKPAVAAFQKTFTFDQFPLNFWSTMHVKLHKKNSTFSGQTPHFQGKLCHILFNTIVAIYVLFLARPLTKTVCTPYAYVHIYFVIPEHRCNFCILKNYFQPCLPLLREIWDNQSSFCVSFILCFLLKIWFGMCWVSCSFEISRTFKKDVFRKTSDFSLSDHRTLFFIKLFL